MIPRRLYKYPKRAVHESATVATILEPAMRARLDAATQGYFTTLHTDSLPDALRAVRRRPVQAILVSPSVIGRDQLPAMGALARRYPELPTVAVVSEHGPASSERLIELGGYGVRRMVDVTVRDGWTKLRGLLLQPAGHTAALISGKVMPTLGDATDETRYFFEVLVRVAPDVCTASALANALCVRSSTFTSRFHRAGLPSPKQYLAAMRLLYAAALLARPGLSVAEVAYRLGYSSPQSFGRNVRGVMGMTAGEFRCRYALPDALTNFTTRLIVPFRATFRSFYPM